MGAKTEWGLMTWPEIKRAADEHLTVLIPAGTVETQGRHTAIGFEHILPQRLAQAVAARTNAIVTPVIPFGWSADFEDYPGTISIRPETLAMLYEDVFRAVLSHGFDHLLVLATHIPNQPMIEQAAYKLRREFGIRIVWTNPGQLANVMLQRVAPNADAVQGHGGEPGVSLGEFLAPGSTVFEGMEPNVTVPEFGGFSLKRMAPSFDGFPVGLPLMLQDVSPESSGSGDPSAGTAELGERIFDLMADYVTELVNAFAASNTRVS
jgi:creatinine amidohydrolase